MNIARLIYISTAREGLTSADEDAILGVARQENAKYGITGLLVASPTQFMQLLEGPEAAVSTIFERIRFDDRHHHVTIVHTRATTERQFPDWTMGFERATPLPPPGREGWFKLDDHPITSVIPQDADPTVRVLFTSFCRSSSLAADPV